MGLTSDRIFREEPRLSWFLGALLLLTAFRVVSLAFNGTDLHTDEAQYWAWSQELAFGYYSKPPLLAWLIAGATSVCGDSEYCVRLPASLVHAATSVLVYLTAAALYDRRVAFWAGLSFATLPGVSMSAFVISTDVPLLFFWALALLAFVRLVQGGSGGVWSIVLGVALGLGLNSKYAMAYFFLSIAAAWVFVPQVRVGFKWWHGVIALAIAVALIIPNMQWNAAHQFATLTHLSENARWKGPAIKPHKALGFLGTQFGVFGPILFGVLLVAIYRLFRQRERLIEADRLMLAFALPVLAVVTLQALISHAYSNWAATAYVSAAIGVVAVMLREDAYAWLKGSLAIGLAIVVGGALAFAAAGHYALPNGYDPMARMLGKREQAAAVQDQIDAAKAAGVPFRAVISDHRSLTTSFLYYGRDFGVPLLAWREGKPRNHFELMRPYTGGNEPVLLVSFFDKPEKVTSKFASVTLIAQGTVPAGNYFTRNLSFFRLEGYKGP